MRTRSIPTRRELREPPNRKPRLLWIAACMRSRRFGLAPHQLVLEITETAMLRSVGDTHASSRSCDASESAPLPDDFGTGHTSSLQHPRDYPVDVLKTTAPLPGSISARISAYCAHDHRCRRAWAFHDRGGREEPAEADAARPCTASSPRAISFSRPVPAALMRPLLDQQRRSVVASHT